MCTAYCIGDNAGLVNDFVWCCTCYVGFWVGTYAEVYAVGYGENSGVVRTPRSEVDLTKPHLVEETAARKVAETERVEMARLFSAIPEKQAVAATTESK